MSYYGQLLFVVESTIFAHNYVCAVHFGMSPVVQHICNVTMQEEE